MLDAGCRAQPPTRPLATCDRQKKQGYNSSVNDEDRYLPVIEDGLDDGAPACSPTVYVSNEEASLFASMRRLRERSTDLMREMGGANPEDRAGLEAELERLREEWRALAKRRERAFINKMIALGHLPPDHPIK